jgi:hypothetical protein
MELKTFADIKKLDEVGLAQYAKEVGGVDLDIASLSKEQMLSKCAGIFLSKKSSAPAPAVEIGTAEPELPLGIKEEKTEGAQSAFPKEKKSKTPAVKSTKEEKAQHQAAIKEHQSATGGKQDFPRCPYCGSAITNPSGVFDGNNNPVCLECADKVNKGKEKAMKTNTKKAAEKKEVKKTTSTKTGKKAVAVKKESAATDKYGFREGSKGSSIFAALIKGATRAELDKIGGAAVSGFLAGIVKNPKDWSAGRSVKFDEAKREKDIYKIASWKPKA